MKRTFFTFSAIASAVALSAISQAGPIEDAAPVSISMGGTTQFDGWNNITSGNNPGYPGFPGTGAWPAPIGSNVAGSGDANLMKAANGAGGGAFPSGQGIYFGGISSAVNANGGTLSITDSSLVSGLKTVVFQVEIGEAQGRDFFNSILPTLSYNGGTQNLASTFSGKLVQAYNGTFPAPTGDEPLYINLWALQWDLSSIGTPISSLDIRFNGVQHSQVYALQLDQSSQQYGAAVFPAPVPEPATLAALGLGAVALIRRRRKK